MERYKQLFKESYPYKHYKGREKEVVDQILSYYKEYKPFYRNMEDIIEVVSEEINIPFEKVAQYFRELSLF